jgi:hypothetical protein
MAELVRCIEDIEDRNRRMANQKLMIQYCRSNKQVGVIQEPMLPFLQQNSLGLIMERLFLATRNSTATLLDLGQIIKETPKPLTISVVPDANRLIEL